MGSPMAQCGMEKNTQSLDTALLAKLKQNFLTLKIAIAELEAKMAKEASAQEDAKEATSKPEVKAVAKPKAKPHAKTKGKALAPKAILSEI